MMAWLAIVRHGEAGPGSPDAERCLTPRGEREVDAAGRWLAERGEFVGARLWASPFRRAQQTAAAIESRLDVPIETVDGLTPEDDVNVLIERLTLDDDSRPLIIVSHMPLVGSLASRLVEGSPGAGWAFPTAGIALLEADVWAAGCSMARSFGIPPHG